MHVVMQPLQVREVLNKYVNDCVFAYMYVHMRMSRWHELVYDTY